MKHIQSAQPKQPSRWQQREKMICHIVMGLLGTVFMIYVQKIEGVVLGSQWVFQSVLLSAGIVLAACRYRQKLIHSAALCRVRIRNIEFWVQRDALLALFPIWLDLASSDDVSRIEIFDLLGAYAGGDTGVPLGP